MSGAGVSAINLLARSRSSQQQWHQYSTPGWPFTLPVFSQHHASQTHRGSQGGQHVRLRLKVTLIQQLLRCYWDERGRMECFVYPTLVTLTSYYSRLLPRQPSANNGYIPLKLAIKFTSAIIKQICKNYCFTFPGLRWKSRLSEVWHWTLFWWCQCCETNSNFEGGEIYGNFILFSAYFQSYVWIHVSSVEWASPMSHQMLFSVRYPR